MANQKDEKQLISDHEHTLKETIYHNATRYLKALLGYYLTKDDILSANKIRKLIRDFEIIFKENDCS